MEHFHARKRIASSTAATSARMAMADMPIWGDAFGRHGLSDEQSKSRIEAIVGHLESIQARGATEWRTQPDTEPASSSNRLRAPT